MNLEEAYDILGIPRGASEAGARAAYKDLVAVWHPDRFQNNARLRQKAEAKLKQINVAFQTIEAAGFPKRPPGMASERPTEPQTKAGPSPPESSTKRRGSRRRWVFAALVLATLCFLIPKARHERVHQSTPLDPGLSTRVGQDEVSPRVPSLKNSTEAPIPLVGETLSAPIPNIGPPTANKGSGPEVTSGQASGAGRAAGYFTLGSTEDEVRKVQGTPTRMLGDTWGYEYSSVEFGPDGTVIAYSDISHNLKVRVVASSKSQKSGRFTIGSTKDEVLAVQGTPTRVAGDTWGYEYSSVEFGPDGAVVGYSDISDNLKVRVTPRIKTKNPGTFTVGSTKDEVLAVQGTPTRVAGDTWGYEYSSVEFGPNRTVVSYANISNNLKVR